jgi:hypothetical protein
MAKAPKSHGGPELAFKLGWFASLPLEPKEGNMSLSGCRRSPLLGSVVAIAAFSLLAAGCGGGSPGSHVAQLGTTATHSNSASPPPTAPGQGSRLQQLLAFSRCMRSKGVPGFPDPTSSGVIPKVSLQQVGVSASQIAAAQTGCRHLLPSGPASPAQARLAQAWNTSAAFAHCMRAHGIPNWPDPTPDAVHSGQPRFDLQSAGIDPNSPLLSSKIHACEPLLHGFSPSIDSGTGHYLPGT